MNHASFPVASEKCVCSATGDRHESQCDPQRLDGERVVGVVVQQAFGIYQKLWSKRTWRFRDMITLR